MKPHEVRTELRSDGSTAVGAITIPCRMSTNEHFFRIQNGRNYLKGSSSHLHTKLYNYFWFIYARLRAHMCEINKIKHNTKCTDFREINEFSNILMSGLKVSHNFPPNEMPFYIIKIACKQLYFQRSNPLRVAEPKILQHNRHSSSPSLNLWN